MRNKSLLSVALALLAMTWVGSVPAQRVESGHTVPFGVPLAPPVYFVNFLLLYFSNPPTAALLPAYRVPLPQPVYECLLRLDGEQRLIDGHVVVLGNVPLEDFRLLQTFA